jgi:hypothetical protein
VVSFTLQPLYPRGKSPRYPFYRRLVGPQSLFGRLGEEKALAPYRDLNSDLSVVQPVASHHNEYAIPAPNLVVYFFVIACLTMLLVSNVYVVGLWSD